MDASLAGVPPLSHKHGICSFARSEGHCVRGARRPQCDHSLRQGPRCRQPAAAAASGGQVGGLRQQHLHGAWRRQRHQVRS